MDYCVLLFKHLSNHMHYITNGYKRFSKTNSSDPSQSVPLNNVITCTYFSASSSRLVGVSDYVLQLGALVLKRWVFINSCVSLLFAILLFTFSLRFRFLC